MKILGIDIGSSSIKAVELESSFGRFEIRDYFERSLGLDVTSKDAIQSLLNELPRPPDKIVVALPTRWSTFRNLTIPSKDKKVIQSTVAFELEDDLPFPIESAIAETCVLSKSKKGSEVHVAATLNQHYESFITSLKEAGLDPDFITTEAWAFRSLMNRIYPPSAVQTPKDLPQLVVNMGNERTLIYGHYRGAPIFCREFAWGGKELTLVIGKKYELTLPEAEKTKIDHGFLLPPSQIEKAKADQVEFSDALLESIEPLIYEIRQASLSCKNLTGKAVAHLLLGGGTSQLPGLPRFLMENLRLPVLTLRGLSQVSTSGVTYSEHTDHHFSSALGAALCLVGPEKNTMVNFRKGPRSKRGATPKLHVENLKAPLAAGGVVLFTLILTLIVEAQYYSNRLTATNEQLEQSIKSFFGNLSTTAAQSLTEQTNELRKRVEQDLNKQRGMGALYGPHPQSPLSFLKNLSQTIPSDVITDLVQFQVGSAPEKPYAPDGDTTTSLTFVFSNAQSADRVATLLGPKLDQLSKTTLTEVPDPLGGPSRWKITFTGKPTESSYAK